MEARVTGDSRMTMTIQEYNARFAAGKPTKKRNQAESKLQDSVSLYVKSKHKGLIFFFDAAAGISLNPNKKTGRDYMVYAMIQRWRSSDGLPDGFFARACGGYHGLFVELKTEKGNPYLKDGSVSKQEHLQNQHKVHRSLVADGYFATFTVGFDHTIAVVDWYMGGCVGECPKYIVKKTT